MLSVSQIFYSLQGEGTRIGVPSIFIRLYRCNLQCSFCDDPYHKSERTDMGFEEILESIAGYESSYIVITGGEPTLYDLNDFIVFLQQHGYTVAVETNGFDLKRVEKADWVTYSPKDWDNIHDTGYDELKFVVRANSPIEKILDLKTDKPIFLQPENHMDTPDMDNVRYCIGIIQAHPHLRFSPQLHKFLGVT